MSFDKKFLRTLIFIVAIFLSKFSVSAFAKTHSNQNFLAQETGFVIAKVNNHIITYFDLEDRYRFVISESKIKVNSADEKLLVLNQIVDKMIDEELIRQEGEKLHIVITDAEIDGVVESLALRQKRSPAALRKSFSQKKLSFNAYTGQLRADLVWSKIISDSVRSRIKITDAEIKEFLEQQKLNTDVIKYLIAEIFIPNDKDSKALATKLSLELKRGANFQNIVRQFSRSPTAENNGELGWVSRSDVDNKIYKAVSALEKNEYSEPVFLSEGSYIFKLLDKKLVVEIKDIDLNEARKKIFSRELEVEAKGYLMELHKRSFIEVDGEKMRKVFSI